MHWIPPRPDDTSREAEDVQIALLREASVERRVRVALSLSAAVIDAARRAIARSDPGASPIEHDLRFVEVHYGPALARDLRDALMERRRRGAAPAS
jgi:hypothetical protein